MTAPTPPTVPDTAVEAYRAAEVGAEGAGVRTDAIRAGLAAALPHLLPAAPSGETAPQSAELALAEPNSCRHCDVPQRSHGQRWIPKAGMHAWTEPTPEQRKQRMLTRRAANAPHRCPIPGAPVAYLTQV